jgi:hypothetical protein
MTEAGCHRDRCTINYENPNVRPTGFLDVKVKREIFEKMPEKITIAKVKSMPGVLKYEQS